MNKLVLFESIAWMATMLLLVVICFLGWIPLIIFSILVVVKGISATPIIIAWGAWIISWAILIVFGSMT